MAYLSALMTAFCALMTAIISNLDTIAKVSTALIAAANLAFAVKIFKVKHSKDTKEKEADRKIQWLKSLIMDYNLEHFYGFFDDLDAELSALKTEGLSVGQKQIVNQKVAELFTKLRRKFIDITRAADKSIYFYIKDRSDNLQDHITEAIFDQGINLAHEPKYDEVIDKKIMEIKTDIIEKIFGYRG